MSQDTLAETLRWFQKAIPTPASKNLHVQLGVHFEEVGEMLMAVSPNNVETQVRINSAQAALHDLATHLKTTDNVVSLKVEDREEFLDAICDQIVTAAGCARLWNLDLIGGLQEVNRSNFSKFDLFEDPIFDPNMKVMKGPNYTKPDLSPFV